MSERKVEEWRHVQDAKQAYSRDQLGRARSASCGIRRCGLETGRRTGPCTRQDCKEPVSFGFNDCSCCVHPFRFEAYEESAEQYQLDTKEEGDLVAE